MNKIVRLAVEVELILQLAELLHFPDLPIGGSQAAQMAICFGAGIVLQNFAEHLPIGWLTSWCRRAWLRPPAAVWINTATYTGPDRRKATGDRGKVPSGGGRRITDLALPNTGA